MIIQQPTIISGGIHRDERGELIYNNDLDLSPICRYYMIRMTSSNSIRAWQGHQIEFKYFTVLDGELLVKLKKIKNWQSPSKDCLDHTFNLSGEKTETLIIPGGYANGFKSLTAKCTLMVFSNKDLEFSNKDDFRFEPETWEI